MSNQSDDSGSDFEDTFLDPTVRNNNVPGVAVEIENHENINKDGKRVRGKDIIWVDYEHYESAEEYHDSD